MTLAQISRHHRWHFAVAVAWFVCFVIVTLLWGLELYYTQAPTSIDYGQAFLVAIASVYFWRVVHRRWRRLAEWRRLVGG